MLLRIAIIILVMTFQKIEISEKVLNEKFSSYQNSEFIKINENTYNDYDVGSDYNYYYPEESSIPFQFRNLSVKRAAFSVIEKDKIDKAVLYLEIFDIECFYEDLVNKYGKPEILSYSRHYLEKKGFKLPTSMDFTTEIYFDSLPEPPIEDYKFMKNINWYFKGGSKTNGETTMIIKNTRQYQLVDATTFEIEVIFRKSADNL